MKKLTTILLLCMAPTVSAIAGSVGALTPFSSGTAAKASEVNSNFSAIKSAVDDNDARITAIQSEVNDNDARITTIQSEVNDNDARITAVESSSSGSQSILGGLQALLPLDVTQGPVTDVPVVNVVVNGWQACYQDLYSDSGTPLADILSSCNKANLMLACRPVGSDVFTVLAAAPAGDVTTDTGAANNGVTTSSNGTGWYFNDSWSWGFVKDGDPATKNSCDVEDTNAGLKLCWHTGGGNINVGYRCGAAKGLFNAGWERIVLHKD